MHRDLSLVRWLTFAALIAVAGVFMLPALQRGDVMFLPTMALIIVAAWLFTWALELWLRLVLQRMTTPVAAAGLEPVLEVQKAFEINRKFLKTTTSQEVLEVAMTAMTEAVNAIGCSFVPFDEWGQSLPALVRGTVPSSAMQHWTERLSNPETRQACKACEALNAEGDCILLNETTPVLEAVRCVTLNRGGRAQGVFNLYFETNPVSVSAQQRVLLEQIVASTSVALQALEWRDDELAALRQMQASSSQRVALTALLDGLLRNLQETLEVDFASFWIPGGVIGESTRASFLSNRTRDEGISAAALPDVRFFKGVWESLERSRQPMLLSNVSLHENELWRSLAALPVMWNDDAPLGILLVGSQRTRVFSQEQMSFLKTVAGEAALIVLNARFMVEVEYQAVLDERARLAREIHDGLAQTLAFLKMQSDQMQMYLAQGKMDRLTDTLKASSRTLNDAYLDARQAIDNLRRVPDMTLDVLLKQTAEEFAAETKIPVDVASLLSLRDVPLNVRAQLMRIVQEALSNVRKHAQAKAVSLSVREHEDELILEVCDDGIGFTPEMVASPAQFGLRGMRERAEMIGAEFQVISRPGEGTIIRLHIPVVIGEEK